MHNQMNACMQLFAAGAAELTARGVQGKGPVEATWEAPGVHVMTSTDATPTVSRLRSSSISMPDGGSSSSSPFQTWLPLRAKLELSSSER